MTLSNEWVKIVIQVNENIHRDIFKNKYVPQSVREKKETCDIDPWSKYKSRSLMIYGGPLLNIKTTNNFKKNHLKRIKGA